MAGAPPIGIAVTVPPVASFTETNMALSTVTAALTAIKSTSNSQLTVLGGTTQGAFRWAMPLIGTTGKLFIGYLDVYENTTAVAQVVSFPTPFVYSPFILHDDSGGATVSTTQLTLPANMVATKTGWIFVLGF